jgi:hypothetical protein
VSDCERLESTLRAYVAGELADTELGPLLTHCRTCRECRQILELHRDLADLGSRAPAPAEDGFEALQARVLGEVSRRERAAERPRASTPWRLPSGFFLRAAAAVAAAVLLFSAGLWAGRVTLERTGANGNGGIANRLVTAIGADAASNRELADVEDSRFTYSNVSFRPVDGGRVALDFDVTTHVQLVEEARSEIVREVLVHSLLNPSTTGARLRAMAYAANAMEPKVQEALIFAMRRDDNLAVRLKALEILSDHVSEPRVEGAILATLRDDDSVQMRLLALEYLAVHHVDRERIRAVIEEEKRPGDEALMVRLAEYQRRL